MKKELKPTKTQLTRKDVTPAGQSMGTEEEGPSSSESCGLMSQGMREVMFYVVCLVLRFT